MIINRTSNWLNYLLQSNPQTWYKAKVQYIVFDERTPKEVFEKLTKELGNLNDYEITDINKSPIVEIFPYVEVAA